MTINDRVMALIKELKVTQKEFAVKTGVKEATLSDIKKHKYEPSAQTIIKICEVYDVNTNWLLRGTGSMFLGEQGAYYTSSGFADTSLTLDEVLDLVRIFSKLSDFDRDLIFMYANSNFDDSIKRKIKKVIDSESGT